MKWQKKNFSNRSSPISEEGCLTDEVKARLHKDTFKYKSSSGDNVMNKPTEGALLRILTG